MGGVPSTLHVSGKPEISHIPSYNFYYGTPIYDIRIPLNPVIILFQKRAVVVRMDTTICIILGLSRVDAVASWNFSGAAADIDGTVLRRRRLRRHREVGYESRVGHRDKKAGR